MGGYRQGFKVLKSELEIVPLHDRVAERICAHVSIWNMALTLHRVMRMRLRATNATISAESVPQALEQILLHKAGIHGAPPRGGV